jgi:hypothetical protein
MRAFCTFFVAALALAGCPKEGARGAEGDLRRLARAHGVTLRDTKCEPVGDGARTRTVMCVTELDPNQVTALVDGVGMQRAGVQIPRPLGCWARVESWKGTHEVAEAWGRPKGAPGFERVRIHYGFAGNATCIELEYASG